MTSSDSGIVEQKADGGVRARKLLLFPKGAANPMNHFRDARQNRAAISAFSDPVASHSKQGGIAISNQQKDCVTTSDSLAAMARQYPARGLPHARKHQHAAIDRSR